MVFSNIPDKYKPYLIPVGVLLAIILLSVTLGNFVLNRVLELRSNNTALREKISILTEKEKTLTSINQEVLRQQAEIVLAAVPNENSVLSAMVTVKDVAERNGLTLTDLKFSSAGQSSTSGQLVNITLALSGGLQPTLTFLEELRKSAPLTKVSKVGFSIIDDTAATDLEIISVWSPLIEKLGKIDQPIVVIESAEEELINRLAELETTIVGDIADEQPATGRENPFSQE